MPRYFAFLRAINVGGHTVKMDLLRSRFDGMGFHDVETFIASGNVIFSSRVRRAATLERTIEQDLLASLGYEVHTFLRTEPELAALARYGPFDAARRKVSRALCVAFLAQPLDAAGRRSLTALGTNVDAFEVRGREIYWSSTTGQGDSKISNAVLERTLKARMTIRGVNTVQKLAAKYGLGADSTTKGA